MWTMIHLAVCEKRILNPPFETLIAEQLERPISLSKCCKVH
jgi:hypothetical protein